MYAKLVTAISGKKKVVYLRLLEKIKKDGRWKDKVVANLGRQDIAGRLALGELLKKLRRFTDEVMVTPEEIESKQVREYGPFLVGKKLWQEIGLDKFLNECCGLKFPVSLGEPGVLAMVLNRLTSPCSKLSLYDWMPTVYLPEWDSRKFRELPDEPVEFAEWFYRTMDWLAAGKNKEKIEERIADWVKNLFAVEIVFYDITNIQFEGWEELKQARHGYIRLGRKNHKQILLGLVMIEGLPVSSHIFRGNRLDKTTLWWVTGRVKKQFNVGRMVFVCDRGMITEKSLLEIESNQDGYIVALRRRKCSEVEPLLQESITSFSPIKMDKAGNITLYAWEAHKEEGKRLIVVFNPIKAKEEKKKRAEIMQELDFELSDIKKKVRTGELKKAQDICARVERILSHKKGKRYFCYSVHGDGHFEYMPNEECLALESNLDGKFIIKTTEGAEKFSLKEVVFRYKDLTEVEDSFRDLKDFIRTAPVYHWRYRRVKAHVFICVLALLLERYLKQKLEKAQLKLSARKAIEKLKTIKIVENQVGPLMLKYVTPPNQELDKILAACGIFKLPRILPGYEKVGLKH
jgi:transposase